MLTNYACENTRLNKLIVSFRLRNLDGKTKFTSVYQPKKSKQETI